MRCSASTPQDAGIRHRQRRRNSKVSVQGLAGGSANCMGAKTDGRGACIVLWTLEVSNGRFGHPSVRPIRTLWLDSSGT
jgi:hypothetical protein